MFDDMMRPVKDLALYPLVHLFQKVPPWLFTLLGLLTGLAGAAALWQQRFGTGLILWLVSRIFDGLDGAVARQGGRQSDFGGYLDILFDSVIYVAIPAGLALGAWQHGGAQGGVEGRFIIFSLVFLISTFYVNHASWMFLSAILEKKRMTKGMGGTSVEMPIGLIGGTETIIFFTAFILFPALFPWLFCLMGVLVVVTIVQRLAWAGRYL